MDLQYIHHYKGFFGCSSSCGIRLKKTGDKIILICTEFNDNKGTSVTNFIEYIAAQIINEHRINPDHMLIIEHYSHNDEPTWDLVTFRNRKCDMNGYYSFADPMWERISDETVNAMLGE